MYHRKIIQLVIFALLMAILLTACKPVKGDLNGDRRITQVDFEICLDIAVGIITPTATQKEAGDINGDGRINSADCALIRGMIK